MNFHMVNHIWVIWAIHSVNYLKLDFFTTCSASLDELIKEKNYFVRKYMEYAIRKHVQTQLSGHLKPVKEAKYLFEDRSIFSALFSSHIKVNSIQQHIVLNGGKFNPFSDDV